MTSLYAFSWKVAVARDRYEIFFEQNFFFSNYLFSLTLLHSEWPKLHCSECNRVKGNIFNCIYFIFKRNNKYNVLGCLLIFCGVQFMSQTQGAVTSVSD